MVREKQVWKSGDVKVMRVDKSVMGQGEVTQYTVNVKQSNVFGVQWVQNSFFDTKRAAVNHAKRL